MKLLKQMVEKKLENSIILQKKGQTTLSYQERISAYLLSLCYLGLKDKTIRKKDNLWYDYVKTLDKQYYLKLIKSKHKEDSIILEAIKSMDIAQEEKGYEGSSLFNEFGWAIISFEHEEAN
jgi:hypothetical protein